jgi:hypothetical protein
MRAARVIRASISMMFSREIFIARNLSGSF